jgi:DNA-binding MarR family transcriptional regulator
VAKGYAHNEWRSSEVDHTHADAINGAIRLIGIRHRALAGALLGKLGLHPGQEALLMELDRHGPRSQVQLAAGIGCEPPSVTLMVRKLEAAGLLTRTPSATDARAVVVDLSEAGRAMMPRLRVLWQQLAEQTVAAFDAVPVPRLAEVLGALATSLGSARSAAVAVDHEPGTRTNSDT